MQRKCSGPDQVGDAAGRTAAGAALRERLARFPASKQRGQRQSQKAPASPAAAPPATVAAAEPATPPLATTTSAPPQHRLPDAGYSAVERTAPRREAVDSATVPRDTAATATGLRHMPEAIVDRLQALESPAREQSGRPARVTTASANAATPAAAGAVPAPPATQPRLVPPSVERLLGRSELAQALHASMRAVKAVGWFSCAINVLMLTGPLFMLQVYDRVLTSGSMPTLVALSALTAALYGVIGLLELVRSRVIVRLGVEIDQRIGDRIFEASLRRSLTGQASSVGALRDLDTLRNFVAGPAPMTAFDAMWTPVYMLVIFLTHWSLGVAATLGALVLLFCAWASETRSRGPLGEAGKSAARSIEMAEVGQRNAAAILAMGMLTAYRTRWQKLNQEALAWQVFAADRLGGLSAVSKALRLLLQSFMLAIGAALAIKGEISAGAIVAGTIIFGRALAPIEQAITHWRASTKAYDAYRKLEELLKSSPPVAAARTVLTKPKGHVEASGLRVAAPETRQLILNNIAFDVRPGQMLAVIGPSASGKSTLVRTLVGLWQPFAGAIRLDGLELDKWDAEMLGRHIGYLPQDVELFAGTVRDNIARFRTDIGDAEVIVAAKAAHAHDLILGLPKGYDTELGAFATYLSAGQRQRIALARALFDNPAVVILDEPNANLDRAGDQALAAAIDGCRARGQAVILVSHRVQAIGMADLILYIERGVQRAFGPRDQVMKMIAGEKSATAARQPSVASAPQAPAQHSA